MRNSAKLGLTALVAALLLASAVSTATAGRLSSNTSGIRTTWSRLEFRSNNIFAPVFRCQVTLEGSLHSRTIVKRERSLIGAVTRADINACTNGTLLPLRLPWHITYESFRGVLPNITGIRLLVNRAQFGFIVLGSTCLYGDREDNLTGELEINAERLARNLVPIEGRNIAHLLEGPAGTCSSQYGLIAGNTDGLTRILGTGGQIKITLI